MTDTTANLLLTPDQQRRRYALQQEFLRSGEIGRLEQLRNSHAGERCFIVGNGPSIRGQDLTLLRDEQVFVTNWFVNHPDYDRIRPDYYCISSHEVFGGWNAEVPYLNEALRSALEAHATPEDPRFFFSFRFRGYMRGARVLPESSVNYLLFDRPKLQIDQRQTMNLNLAQPLDDGYTGIITFALPLARFMGFTKVYLLGCDSDYGISTENSEKKYFYASELHATRTTSHEGLMRAWAPDGPAFQAYRVAGRLFREDGISITNLTRGGRLEVFPRLKYEDVIAGRDN